MNISASFWIVISGGEIVEVHKVQRTEDTATGIKYTNIEAVDNSGRFWRMVQFGFVVASDGTIGKLCLDRALAEVWAKGLHRISSEVMEEQQRDDYEASQALSWEIQGMLYGIGLEHEVRPFAQKVVDVVKGHGAESMVHAMTIVERLLEGTVEAAMRNRNSVVDEQGYAEEIWWAGWEEFKRKQWEDPTKQQGRP